MRVCSQHRGLFNAWGTLVAWVGILLYSPTQAQSVLAQGTWHQVAVAEDGIYRLDRRFLEQHGILSASDSLRHLRVYGQRSGPLPQANDAPAPIGLTELATWVSDTTADEYLLFYGEGPDRRYYDTAQQVFRVERHPYDTANYYFLTVAATGRKEIGERPSVAPGQDTLITERQAVYHHERALTNLLGSGRQWWGEALSKEASTLPITFPAPEARQATLEVSVMSRATTASRFTVSVDAHPTESLAVKAAQRGEYGYLGRSAHAWFPLGSLPDRPTVTLDYKSPTAHSGHLDYLTLNTRESLVYRQSPLRVAAPWARQGILHQYQVARTDPGLLLWDVTDPLAVQQQAYRRVGGTLRFRSYADTLREFMLFDPTTVTATPHYVTPVANQDLLSVPTPELLIITTPTLVDEAARLAAFRKQHDGLLTQVVTLPQIYRAFSSGKQDVTAVRNFIRTLYQQDKSLRYVLFFGDASYDYSAEHTVPTYQSRQSLHSVHSYASDDYFGLMDTDEGEWSERGSEADAYDLEIGIGRLPVGTPSEARVVVDKLIGYAQSPEAHGKWQKELLFVADDGDANKHQHQSDFLASYVEQRRPELNVRRLFLDAFPQEDQRAPVVRQRLQQAVEQGVLLVDFIGHGGETAWTNEQILDLELIESWSNGHRLPVFLTATCEFGRFDDPQRASGAEAALLHPSGGAIALFTTTRPVFTNTNFDISTAFYEAAFGTDTLTGKQPLRLGDIIQQTKNRSVAGTINRNFVLLGDPSMALRTARQSVSVTSLTVNETATDTLRPLDRLTVRGQITGDDGLDSSFNGTVSIDLLAPPQETTTLGQEDSLRRMTFYNRDHRLFRGAASVRGGVFELSFVLPKNMPAEYGPGKLSFYAVDEAQAQEATGGYEPVVLGDAPLTDGSDRTPPVITLFFNKETQPVPTTLYPHPTLIVHLEDESGINIADEAHGLRLVVDEWQTFVINDSYEAAIDHPEQGKARFVLPELVSGSHTLRLIASDAHLNTGERSLSFNIVGDSVLLLQDVVVYPNPSHGKVTVSFSVGKQVTVSRAEWAVYNSLGHTMDQRTFLLESGVVDHSLSFSLTGVPLGIYPYRILIFDTEGNHQSHYGRLVIE